MYAVKLVNPKLSCASWSLSLFYCSWQATGRCGVRDIYSGLQCLGEISRLPIRFTNLGPSIAAHQTDENATSFATFTHNMKQQQMWIAQTTLEKHNCNMRKLLTKMSQFGLSFITWW
jgi:hypothetical protein